jgi:excisionase family DNA binding protein
MKNHAVVSTNRRSPRPSDGPPVDPLNLQQLPAVLTSREAANASEVREVDAQVELEQLADMPARPSAGEPELPQFLSVVEVAAVLRVDRKTVHKLIASGDLPHVRLGRVLRIPASVLESLCKSA